MSRNQIHKSASHTASGPKLLIHVAAAGPLYEISGVSIEIRGRALFTSKKHRDPLKKAVAQAGQQKVSLGDGGGG